MSEHMLDLSVALDAEKETDVVHLPPFQVRLSEDVTVEFENPLNTKDVFATAPVVTMLQDATALAVKLNRKFDPRLSKERQEEEREALQIEFMEKYPFTTQLQIIELWCGPDGMEKLREHGMGTQTLNVLLKALIEYFGESVAVAGSVKN